MIRLILSGRDGFDLGAFVWTWRRLGPFMLYREMLSSSGDPPPLTGWKLAVFFSKAGLAEFYEGTCK